MARRHRIPATIIRRHEEAIQFCQRGRDLPNELAEHLHLAESFRQFGWVGQAQAELEYVADVAEQLALPTLRRTSLTRLVQPFLDAAQRKEAAKAARRIAIMGVSRADKITLARRLSQCLDYPHVELDEPYWTSLWTPTPTADLRANTRQALRGESWIADGNYSEVRDIVWTRADLLVWPDYSPRQIVGHRLRQVWQRLVKHGDSLNEERRKPGTHNVSLAPGLRQIDLPNSTSDGIILAAALWNPRIPDELM